MAEAQEWPFYCFLKNNKTNIPPPKKSKKLEMYLHFTACHRHLKALHSQICQPYRSTGQYLLYLLYRYSIAFMIHKSHKLRELHKYTWTYIQHPCCNDNSHTAPASQRQKHDNTREADNERGNYGFLWYHGENQMEKLQDSSSWDIWTCKKH